MNAKESIRTPRFPLAALKNLGVLCELGGSKKTGLHLAIQENPNMIRHRSFATGHVLVDGRIQEYGFAVSTCDDHGGGPAAGRWP